ncbi:transcriptional activator of comK gene [Salirhabdus euzebyi]|uniref:Transcriptional activator of comK protein n=1 Tax=Salirhabdus euzebyi TaxID=394506 RepID=A0A841Q3T9_9BACI|nr:BMP family ABC transporter substrate-binding protein [Salirhabdus euzebyi]MBB6453033.1 transcriptional activator of comK gene [Salirhabdus euzebyi]
MKRTISFAFIVILLVMTSCSNMEKGNIENVGLLVEGTIHDQTWGKKGYLGLLNIKEELDVNVYFKEGVNNQQEVNEAVDALAQKDVNLIFGHSSSYGEFFSNIYRDYPDIQFVYFNGDKYRENLTSLNFNSNAMGFFAGMVAAQMSKTDHVGVISSFEWQPEVGGFYEGAKYQNPNAKVEIRYVNSWDNQERALEMYDQLKEKGVDVFYPAGDGFNVPIINKIKQDGLYAIGYISDQISLGESTILTSTVQHVDHLYLVVAERMQEGTFQPGILQFDFQDGVISMGTFSEVVPEDVKEEIMNAVDRYIQTGKLPNEK